MDFSGLTVAKLFGMVDKGIITVKHLEDIFLPMGMFLDPMLQHIFPHHPAIAPAIQALPTAPKA